MAALPSPCSRAGGTPSTLLCNNRFYSDHSSQFLPGHVFYKVLWPLTKSKYGSICPQIGFIVTSIMCLYLHTTNYGCLNLWKSVFVSPHCQKWSANDYPVSFPSRYIAIMYTPILKKLWLHTIAMLICFSLLWSFHSTIISMSIQVTKTSM